jgi:hypothetical protein
MGKFRSILGAAAVAIAVVFQPGAASAQAQIPFPGADGYTRVMWRGTDGSISLWKLDGSWNAAGSHNYGPYAGWSPLTLTVVGNNTYVLWTYTDGTATIWELDANLNFITSRVFGPAAPWSAYGLGVANPGNLFLVWKTPENQVTAWVIDSALNVLRSGPVYGPYFGWQF